MIHRPGNRSLIVILGALSTISPFAIDMYLPSFPRIAASMHVEIADISLSVSSYFIGYAVGQVFYGPLLDRYGRKRPLYAGLLLFALASAGCMSSTTAFGLIGWRVVQALGGCSAGVAALAMVRDFFPVEEGAKIMSLLILVISVSPLLAPSFGGFVAGAVGWQGVFVALAAYAGLMALVTWRCLPESHAPDPTVSLRPLPIARGFLAILRNPQFATYALTGAFAFSGLLVYVAGAPIIFMTGFQVGAGTFGGIFAFLSVGFIGSNQVNILLLRRYRSRQIFQAALSAQVLVVSVFLAVTLAGALTLPLTVALFFAMLSCAGLAYPNAVALAMAPFGSNAGSAAALVGFLQVGVSSAASGCLALLHATDATPVVALEFATPLIAIAILLVGQRRIPTEIETETLEPPPVI